MSGEERGSKGSDGSLGSLLVAMGPGSPAGPSACSWHWILLGGSVGGPGSLKTEKKTGRGECSWLHLIASLLTPFLGILGLGVMSSVNEEGEFHKSLPISISLWPCKPPVPTSPRAGEIIFLC